MDITRILVPVDFSEPSRKALIEAAQLAKERDAMLTLLYVYQITEVAVMDFVYMEPAEKIAEVTAAAEQELKRWAEQLALPAGRWKARVVTGAVISEILDEAVGHELIVMGTHGRSGLSHFLLGSVAERVVQAADCSVLIVKDQKPTSGDEAE